MKIHCTITDPEFEQIQRHIDCREWTNPQQDEFIFCEPTPAFLMILALTGIDYYEENK